MNTTEITDPEAFRATVAEMVRHLERGAVTIAFIKADGTARIMRATRQGMDPWRWDGKSLTICVKDLGAKGAFRSFRLDRLTRFEPESAKAL